MGTVRYIFLAPSRDAPMVEATEVRVIAGRGLVGDRYTTASIRRGPDYEVSMIALEAIDAFVAATGLPSAQLVE